MSIERTHDEQLQPFWAACNEGRLVLQQCAACGSWRWPPRGVCASCHSWDYTWEAVPGTGEVASFVVVHRAFDRDFAGRIPYVVALVGLDETDGDVLFLSNLVDCDPNAAYVGMRVSVTFCETPKHPTVPQFKPAKPST